MPACDSSLTSSSSTSFGSPNTFDSSTDFPTSLPLSDSSCALVFNKHTEHTRYDAISSLPYMAGKPLHLDTLNALWIRDEVSALICGVRWDIFFHLRLLAFIELIHEFYCTFFFHKTTMLSINMAHIVSFRLLGYHFCMSIAEFNPVLGFESQVSTCDFPPDFDANSVYADFCDHPLDAYYSNKSKDLFLCNTCLKYLHRF